MLSEVPQLVPKHFELGKHCAKLTVEDNEDAVIILRPRYQMEPHRLTAMLKGIDQWKKSNKVALRVLIVPHDFDIFAVEIQNTQKES
jgi:hypothetical protein